MKACHSANSIIILAFVAVALVAALSTVATAEAHALLIRSNPPANALLEEPAERITTWFSEPLEPGVSTLRVLTGPGERVDLEKVDFDPADSRKMSVALRDNLSSGFYLVTWETLSRIDGHFRFGSFEFTVLNPDGSQPTGPRPEAAFDVTGTPTGLAEGAVTKTLGLIGAVILVGGLAAVVFVALPSAVSLSGQPAARLREAARGFLAWVALPAVALLLLTAMGELWLQAKQFGGIDQLARVLDTEWGQRWVWRQLALGVLTLSLLPRLVVSARSSHASGLSLWSALAAGFFYLLLVSLVSHANAVSRGSFWATASDFIHLAAAAVWIGGLVAVAGLLLWSRRAVGADERPVLLATAVRRFSLIAATSLVLLLATGACNALVQVSTWSALIETAYGRALTVKLVLLLPLLAVAGLNGFILRPRLVEKASKEVQEVEGLRRLLARMVPLEAALGIAVLAVVGVLGQYTPARVETEAAAPLPAGELLGVQDRGAFDFPLVTGDGTWVAAAALLVAGVLLLAWAAHVRPRQLVGRWARASALALAAVAALIAVINLATPSGDPAFEAAVALRYEATDGRQVLLEVDPFQVGPDTFKATVMTEQREVVQAESVALRFSRLEVEGPSAEVVMTPSAGGEPSYFAQFELTETGWWAIDVIVDRQATTTFYPRLDNPSQAPLTFAGPHYQSDPTAEEFFQEALAGYEGLASVRWREELTSGLLAPTGIGAWVITTAQVEAPDRVHYEVPSPGFSQYEVYRVGDMGCSRAAGEGWQCNRSEAAGALDLDYLRPTAFRMGRREPTGGEMARVLLFYNPSQPAWYAWWVGEETGFLLKQAMVAPGHFMLTDYFGHNQPVEIEIPKEALASGG